MTRPAPRQRPTRNARGYDDTESASAHAARNRAGREARAAEVETLIPPTAEVEALVARITGAAEAALAAFWATVAERFPEITTGDLGPRTTVAIEDAAHDAVEAWVTLNLPADADGEV